MNWLWALFLFSTLVSQTAMDVFASLLLIFALFQIKNKNPFLIFPPQLLRNLKIFSGVVILWFSICAIGFLVNSPTPSRWLPRLIEFKWLILFLAFVWSAQQIPITEKFLKNASIALIFCALYAICAFAIGYDPIYGLGPGEVKIPFAFRTGGFLGNPMTFAHSYGMIAALCFGFALNARSFSKQTRLWIYSSTLLVFIAVFLSFTRGVWIGLGIATLLMSFLFRPKVGFRVLFTSILVFIMLFFSWQSFQDRILMAFDLSKGYDFERVWIWKANLQVFKEYPFFGIGYGENTRHLPEYYEKVGAPAGLIQSHAHNQYLHIAAGSGLFGLLCYLFLCGFLLLQSFSSLQRTKDPLARSVLIGSLGAQICFLIGGLTESNFEHSKVRFVLMVIWALALVYGNSRKEVYE